MRLKASLLPNPRLNHFNTSVLVTAILSLSVCILWNYLENNLFEELLDIMNSFLIRTHSGLVSTRPELEA